MQELTEQEQELFSTLRTSGIPSYMHDMIVLWITEGIYPGNFMGAILENRLQAAVAHADENNMALLHLYVGWLYNHAPSSCFGSPEAVVAWQKQHLERRMERDRDQTEQKI